MDFNPAIYRYASRRTVVYGARGIVATGHPLAAQAGLDIMKKGGNAIDAAVATAACLTVVEPTANGIGGDSFAIFWMKGKLHGMNSSGYAPKNADPEKLRKMGHETVQTHGWHPVTVPGAPGAWAALVRDYGSGKLTLAEVLEPAISYAENGQPLAVHVGGGYAGMAKKIHSLLEDPAYDNKECFKPWLDLFAPGGNVPKVGDIWRSHEMAETLKKIGDSNADAFYRGELTEKILDFSRKTGGIFTKEDFENYKPEFLETISANYRGYDVHEIPPNGHGIVALIALNILKGFEMTGDRDSAANYHKQIESIKLAFADAQKYVADPRYMNVSFDQLLSESYADERRKLIGEKAIMPLAGDPASHGTVYLCAADGEGNMISYIQSNYMGFGSGIVVPGTGISLHNRGNNFSLEKGHANEMLPGKKPYHTIIPGFLMKDGKPVGPFGVMGGFMQPQGHLQVVSNLVDFGMNPQDALNAPRWQWKKDKDIDIEMSAPKHSIQELSAMGHAVNVTAESGGFGRGQIIMRMDNGALCAGSEPRTDGLAAAW